MHVVVKASSTTTKVRAVLDALAKSSSSISLNGQLLDGLTVHSYLMNILLHVHFHVSHMWLCKSESQWPTSPDMLKISEPSKERETILHASITVPPMLAILDWVSYFTYLKRTTAWMSSLH